MHYLTSLLKCKFSNVRFVTTAACLLANNHYDSLGLSPKATQRDIKTAYYKLSMLYHPDKSSSEASTQKFRSITEAYEVLGNVKLRRLYDKGIGHVGTDRSTGDPVTNFYKSRDNRFYRVPSTGRTPIYNFDEWTREHYSRTFARNIEYKQKKEFEESVNSRDSLQNKFMRIQVFVLGIMVIYVFLFHFIPSNFDDTKSRVEVRRKNEVK